MERNESIEGLKAKTLGAYYTDQLVADFLVWWAVRSPEDTVMDPAFGGGVFLRAAVQRISQLRGEPASRVYGVEFAQDAFDRFCGGSLHEVGLDSRHLIRSDFFELDPSFAGGLSAIVGNPPYIRYQRFAGSGRELALRRAAEADVRLSKLTSSWAPFVAHSSNMLRKDGRLALVLPMELVQAAYARPILKHLSERYRGITLVTFRRRIFPRLNQDVLLLLADGKDCGPARFHLCEYGDADILATLQQRAVYSLPGMEAVDGMAIADGQERLLGASMPARARELYRALASENTIRLNRLADVGIGYVTGANGFFHLTSDQAAAIGIPSRFLLRTVLNARSLRGPRFTARDWAEQGGNGAYLLKIDGHDDLPQAVRRYLRSGTDAGADQSYKCRSRTPWYAVPNVYTPEAFMSYMAGDTHRFVVNEISAVAPNSLHVVRMRSGSPLSADALSVLWLSSLTRLSCEVEGHAMGGGMLKLEPTEAGRVLLPLAQHIDRSAWKELSAEVDSMLRSGRRREACDLVDRVVLIEGMGLTVADCRDLDDAVVKLRERRTPRRHAA
jgi:adenine-specific DNA-methyltransferase